MRWQWLSWVRGLRPWPLLGLILGLVVALALVGLVVYSTVELERFGRAETRRTTYLYAAGQPLTAGVNVRAIDLASTLSRLRYAETRQNPVAPGQFRRTAGAWDIYLHARDTGDGHYPAERVRVEVAGDRVTRVIRDGTNIGATVLEPEVLTSAGGTSGEDFRPVKLAEVPFSVINAVLAAEDHRFFEHRGVDVRGLVRAAWANLRAGRVTQGGSTLTQQLVKNRLLGPQRTYVRKIREGWLAALIDWRYPKEQILQAYLNEIYLGQRGPLAIHGVGAAARAYFRKEVHQLSVGEAAILAGMVRAPNMYSPAVNPERARQRRDVVLARMHELGMLNQPDYERAKAEPLRAYASGPPGQRAPYFSDFAREELEEQFGSGTTLVYTTLDTALQRFAETAVTRGLARLETQRPRLRRAAPVNALQAALIALDPVTGQIRALVGGRDYTVSQFNRAALARRQPGSAFKPFVYLAALSPRGGDRPSFTAASVIDDSPLTLTVGNQTWSPRNYDDRYEGAVRVRQALEHSLNAATVRLAQAVSLKAVVDTARTLGLTGDLAPVPAAALGAFEVTPLDLARAYLAFANGGIRHATTAALRVVYDADGTAMTASSEEPVRVMQPAEAYLMTSLLQGVVDSGTAASARALGLTAQVAGKTGTTNDGRDAWFVGYTPTLLALVWVGFDNNEAHGMSGGEAAVPIWTDFMKQALEAYPSPAFTVPDGVTVATIDTTNGKLANRFCPITAREVFLTGTEPEECTEHGGAVDQMGDWWRRFRDWLRR